MLRGGFKGPIYPVNPNRSEIQGLLSFPSIEALPTVPDVAVVAVPAALAISAVESLGALGVGMAVVLSAGFAEAGGGDEGTARQNEMVAAASRHGMRLLGPNCLGAVNSRIGWYGTFTSAFDGGWPLPGRVGIVSQSGAFGSHLLCLARNRGIGTPLLVTTGNEADITVGEVMHGLVDDEQTDVIVAYAEGVKDPEKFIAGLEAARRAKKPVVMIKVGRSALGLKAALSHTASIAGDDAVFDAVLKEFGVVRARSAEQLLDIAYTATQKIYPVSNTLGVVTISGGVGVLITDTAEDSSLLMPPMPADAQRRLIELVPFASPGNPVDCTAQAVNDTALIRTFTKEMIQSGGYSSVLGFLAQMGDVPAIADKLMNDLSAVRAEHPDRLFVLAATLSAEREKAYNERGFVVIEDPVRATHAIAAMGRFGESFAAEGHAEGPAGPLSKLTLPEGPISEATAKALLAENGISVAPEQVCRSANEACAAARALGFPVVMKILSADIAHKTEIGGVLLNVLGEESVRSGFDLLIERARAGAPSARIDGVLVARQLTDGIECIVGIQRDPVFGPVAMFGLGGIFVEAMNDVVLKRCPFTPSEAEQLIRSIRSVAVLEGMRNRPPADIPAVARLLSALSVFATRAGSSLRSIDLNPVLVMPAHQGAYALDALIEVEPLTGHGQ